MAENLRVISANRLRDGAVVYFGRQDRWVEEFDHAEPFRDAAELEAALARARAAERSNLVLDILPVDALVSDQGLRPAHIREAIRAAGPTVRVDHGKQADRAVSADSKAIADRAS